MEYITTKEASQRWGLSRRRVQLLCEQDRIPGVKRLGKVWFVPETAEKPKDGRVKSGLYTDTRSIQQINQKQSYYSIPEITHDTVFRSRLLEKMATPNSKLTYIHADAGYGKTTLLTQYARGRDDVVWLSLDEKDSDGLFFFRHLEDSIREKLHQFDFHSTDYIPFIGSKTFIPTFLSALLKAIEPHKLTIIIDDVHVINNDTVTDLLTEWVKVCPSNLTLIMASRHELWSGLFRVKMAGGISELTKKDLCFSQEETEKLWGFSDLAAYSATEGWILGIRSYLIAAENDRNVSMSRVHFNRNLYRYLLNEIFMRLPVEIQHFLKATSYLPVLEVSMCNRLLDIDNSEEILEELMRRNIFTWHISAYSYRYHNLFCTFLQRNDNELGRATLRKAITQCYDSGDFEQAADYALILEDGNLIQDCISALLDRPFDGNHFRNLKKYFDFLEDHPMELSPRILLIKGMYLSDQGSFYEAEKYLSEAIPKFNREDHIIYLRAITHKARVLRNRVSFEESSRCIDSLLPLLEGAPMQEWYGVMIEKIHNLTLTSKLSDALELTLAMMEKSLVSGDTGVKAWFERYLTVIYFYMGDYKSCLKVYEKSLSIPKEEQDWLMRHCVGIYAAKAYQIAGQEEKVLPLLEAELEHIRKLGIHEEFSITYLIYAETLHATELLKFYMGEVADFSASFRYINMAEEYAVINRSTRDHSLFAKIWNICAKLMAQPEKTGEYVEEALTLMDDSLPFFQSVAYGRIANALDILGQNPEQCKEYFYQCIKIGEAIGSYAYATIAYGRLAGIYLKEGDIDRAKDYTRRFMELSRQYDHRYYIRIKPIFEPVLKLAAKEGITPEFTREMLSYGGYVVERVYINSLGGFYITPSHDRETPVKIRTQKSRELLAYLLENWEGVAREQIFVDLWGDSEANVSSLFHTRRGEIKRAFKTLGAENPIIHENGIYRLNMEEITWDYDSFQQATDEFRLQATPENAQKVVDLYTGRYLDNLEALWAESARLRCEDSFLEAAEILLESYRVSGKRAKTMDLLRRCRELSHHGHRYLSTKVSQKKK